MSIVVLLLGIAVPTVGFFLFHEKGSRVSKKFVDFHKNHEVGTVKFGRN